MTEKRNVCACSVYTPERILKLKMIFPHAQLSIEPCEQCGVKIIVSPASVQLKDTVRMFCNDCADTWLEQMDGKDFLVAMSAAQIKEVTQYIARESAKNN